MSRQLWSDVDGYIAELLLGDDPALDAALQASAAAGLPPIAVSPPRASCCTCWRASTARAASSSWARWAATARSGWRVRCRADGRLVTLELDPQLRAGRRANIERAGLAGARRAATSGRALGRAARARRRAPDPFDLIFIDADKQSTPEYFERRSSSRVRAA